MIRLLGAITGSALALATLLVFVGVPQFKFDSDEPADAEQSLVTLPLPTQPVERAIEPLAEALAAPAEPLGETMNEPLASTPEPAISPGSPFQTDIAPAFGDPEYLPDPLAVLETGQADVPEDGPGQADVPELEPDTLNWYAFWSPFRSEIAANGFVDQLERVTGLDYRVVKIKPGVYEVAFAYADDAEIAGNLSRITAATGLEMPEG